MKNQITKALNGAKAMLAVVLMTLLSVSSFGQGGPGHGGPGHGGPGHHGGPGNHGGPGGHHACNAHFAHHRDTIVNGIVFNNFNGTGAATYAWDFGDGSTSTSVDPSHTYAAAGMYYVCLTITDTIGGGCTDTKCDSIHVFTPAPHCNAHYNYRGDSIPNTLNFNSAPNSPGTAYAWDFGDGSTSTDANPSHLYAAAGSYYVCLIVSNTNAGGSCADTLCDSVNTAGHPHQGNHGHHGHHRLASSTGSVDDAVVSIYPNPMVDNATIYIENTSGNAVIHVYGISGQIVMTKQLSNGDNNISKENLQEGLYFYSVDDGNVNIAKGKLRVY